VSPPDPPAYVTEIDCQSTGNEVLHSLHTRMPDPEPLPDPEPETEAEL
jgi:hypothetical protein